MDGKDVLRLPIHLYMERFVHFKCIVWFLVSFSYPGFYNILSIRNLTRTHTSNTCLNRCLSLFFRWTEKAVNRWFCQKHQSKTMYESVLQLEVFFGCECECQSQTLQTRKISNMLEVEVVFWYNCTHVMVVAVVQSTILNEMNSPMRQKNNGPGFEPLKAVIVSLRKYWGLPFDLIRNVKYIATYFWKLEAYPDGHATNSPKIGGFLFCEI